MYGDTLGGGISTGGSPGGGEIPSAPVGVLVAATGVVEALMPVTPAAGAPQAAARHAAPVSTA